MTDPAIVTGKLLRVEGAEALCPATGLRGERDLWIEDGVLRLEDPGGEPDAVLSARGLLAVPGFIEIHAHLREPGFTRSETVASGLAAALAGGYTAVFAMANTRPVNDDPAVTTAMLESARAAGSPVRLYPVSAATRGMRGEEPADYEAQRRAGAAAVSDDGLPVRSDEVMAACMAAAAAAGLPIFDHATHGPDGTKGVVNEGEPARERGLPGLPREEEDALVRRNIRIAEETGHPVHISHLSTAASLAAVARAKERGVPVTAEVTPHHLLLTDRDATTPDHKMNPPLRTEEDRQALVRGLRGGVIDAVATDHAPHAPELKARGMLEAPFGVIGMETAWPVLYTRLVREGSLGLEELLGLFTAGPARVGRVPGGRLAAGERAELNLIDLEARFVIRPEGLRSLSRNCPFLGWEVAGRIVATVAGRTATLHVPERFRSHRA